MGRIYGSIVRKAGNQLLARYPGLFDEDFSSNKEKMKDVMKTGSKELTNKVTGYVTSRVRAANKRKVPPGDGQEEPETGSAEAPQEENPEQA